MRLRSGPGHWRRGPVRTRRGRWRRRRPARPRCDRGRRAGTRSLPTGRRTPAGRSGSSPGSVRIRWPRRRRSRPAAPIPPAPSHPPNRVPNRAPNRAPKPRPKPWHPDRRPWATPSRAGPAAASEPDAGAGGGKNHGKRKAVRDLADVALRKIVPDERLTLTRIQLAWSQHVPGAGPEGRLARRPRARAHPDPARRRQPVAARAELPAARPARQAAPRVSVDQDPRSAVRRRGRRGAAAARAPPASASAGGCRASPTAARSTRWNRSPIPRSARRSPTPASPSASP